MKVVSISLAAMFAWLTSSFAAPSYVVSRTVPLGAPDKWDYVTYDAATRRVLVSHGDHTDVVGATDGRILGKLEGLHGAHGQATDAAGLIYADSGKTAQLTEFDPTTFRPIHVFPAGIDADAVVAEPVNKLIAVMDGDGRTATLVDSVAQTVKSTVPLGGSPEFAAADGAGDIYVNIESTGEIARVDAAAGRVTARIPVPGCQSPHGLAIDAKTRRLFTTCVNARIMVVDLDLDKVVQTLPIGHGTDAAAFDPVRRQVFSSNGDGTLSVFDETAGRLSASATVRTAPGARTMAIDPATGRVFLVTADVDPTRPPIRTARGLRPNWKPGSVKLLFLDPSAT